MFMFGYFLKLFIIYFFIADGLCIAKWYMHTLCRRFLFDYGGELVLDESLFPRHEDSCFITIVGNGSQYNKISFFFSSFYVGSDCQANVTLIDGIANIYTRKVLGLEKSLCKYDILDERSIFETREKYLGVMFHRRRDRWRRSANVSLTLKFVSFQNQGQPCDPEDTGKMYSCPNGRCINKNVLCKGLNPCGDFSDACEESGVEHTTATVVLSSTKYIIIGVGAFVGFLCLAQGCFIVRRCCCGKKDGDENNDEEKIKSNSIQMSPEPHKNDRIAIPEGDQNIDIDSLAEESLNLLAETVRTESESEIKYRTDSDKDSFEEINHKLNAVIETDTNLKRTYV